MVTSSRPADEEAARRRATDIKGPYGVCRDQVVDTSLTGHDTEPHLKADRATERETECLRPRRYDAPLGTATSERRLILREIADFPSGSGVLRRIGLDFKLPFLLIHGSDDHITPTSMAASYFEKINAPTKRMILIDKAGHFAPMTHMQQFAAALSEGVRLR